MLKAHLDIILFILFLSINLILGLLAGRRVKNIRDFSVGNKDFSTATITSTIVATWIGGGFMFYGLQNVYTNGFLFIIPMLGGSLCLLFTGKVLAVRMGEFLNNLTVAEAMGDMYGTIVRVITAISGILGVMGYIAVQFQVIGKMLTFLLNLEGPTVTIAAATVVILYSAFGGIRSVLITDVLQFIVFSIFIPILALVVWNHLKNPALVGNTLTNNPIFSFKETLKWEPKLLDALGLMLYFIIPGLNPAIFQRIIMAKDARQINASFTYSAGIRLVIVLGITWVAILLLSDNPSLEPNGLVNYLIATYSYPGLKGLIAIGIASMAMSTADSFLNSSSVLAVNDIVKVFNPNYKNSVTTVRLFSISIGAFSLLLALKKTDLLNLILLSTSFYMPIVTVPLLLAIFGFRTTSRSVLIGMATGFTTVALWDYVFKHLGINSVIPGMIANLTFLMGSHYILREKGGWVGIKVTGPLIAARQARKDAWIKFIKSIKETKIYDYLEKNLPEREIVYSGFAIYVMGATYSSFYTIPEQIIANYDTLYKIIYHSVLVATAAFLTFPAWPPTFKSKRFIAFAWPAGIFYILFVVGSMLVIMSGFHEVQVMIFMVNLLIAAFSLSFPLMVLLSSFGTLIGYIVFKLIYGTIYYIGAADCTQFKAIYMVLLFGSLLVALFRFKKSKQVLEVRNTYLEKDKAEQSAELADMLSYREVLLKELNQEELSLFDHTTAAYLNQIIYRMTEYIRLEVTSINLEKLMLEIKDIIKVKYVDKSPQIILKNYTQEEAIHADTNKLKRLLLNGINYVNQHNPSNEPVTIILEDAKLGHSIGYMKDYTRQIAALKISIVLDDHLPPKKDIYMFDQFVSISQPDLQTEKRKLVENFRIIHAHYGYGELDQEQTQVYVLPINVREVRGKVMELLRAPAIADAEEIKHPLAIQLEKELFDKIQGKQIDERIIIKALDTVKRYHAGVKRKSGEPFFTHPIQVALIVLDYSQDQEAVLGALLHDTVEDTSLSLLQIEIMFGKKVAFIVDKVTNLKDELRRVSLQDHENIYRLINYEDERAAYVKLADRLHNMRTISGHSSLAKQKHIANETLNFFVPLAKNLGLGVMTRELEKLSLAVLGKR
jgi:Na+/proline symporter